MKAMLAEDWVEEKLKFPVMGQPKIDGVRGHNTDGTIRGRSLKTFKNLYTTYFYSHPVYTGLDGELAAGFETDADLCRKTTSALNTIKGEPYTLWHVFDLLIESTLTLPYIERYDLLEDYINQLHDKGLATTLNVVDFRYITSMKELLYFEEMWLEKGYEGVILRDPNGMHKGGRSTVREGGLLRIKRFVEEDAIVLEIVEGQMNANPAQVNELGLQYRTTHKENMVPNGKVGMLICADLKTGEVIDVAAGKMTDPDRAKYFWDPSLIVGQTIKYKHFPKGVKDKRRFPTFQSIRMKEDQ